MMTSSAIERLRVSVVSTVAILCAAFAVAGCSHRKPRPERDVMNLPPVNVAAESPAPPQPAAQVPSADATYTSDQLVLSSQVQRIVTKQGLVFLRFKYADRDGVVRECELPQAMAQSSYSISGWLGLFRAYSKPPVVIAKPVKQPPSYIYDLPIISPTPRSVARRPQPSIPSTVDLSGTGLFPGEIELQPQATATAGSDTPAEYVGSSDDSAPPTRRPGRTAKAGQSGRATRKK